MPALVLAALNDPMITVVALIGLLLGVFLMARGIKPDTGSSAAQGAPDAAEAAVSPTASGPAQASGLAAGPTPGFDARVSEAEPPAPAGTSFRQGQIKLGGGPSERSEPDAQAAEVPAAPAEESAAASQPSAAPAPSDVTSSFRQGRIRLRRRSPTDEPPPVSASDPAPQPAEPAPPTSEAPPPLAPEAPPPPAPEAPPPPAPELTPSPAATSDPSAPSGAASFFRQGAIKLRRGQPSPEPLPPAAEPQPAAAPEPTTAEEAAALPESAASPAPPPPPEPATSPEPTPPSIPERESFGHGTIRLRP